MEHDVGEQHCNQNAQLIDGRDEAGRAELPSSGIVRAMVYRTVTQQAMVKPSCPSSIGVLCSGRWRIPSAFAVQIRTRHSS